MKNLLDPTVKDQFFAPIKKAIENATLTMSCRTFSDEDFLTAGIGRVIEVFESGRDWIQKLRTFIGSVIPVDCTFKSLRSDRRLRMLTEVAKAVALQSDQIANDDPFSGHLELANFEIYAGDGHYHKAAAHDRKIDDKKYPVQHFYAINMRTGTMHHLDVARPALGKKKENDITALKRFERDILRMGTSIKRKVLWAYDRAVIDFVQWYKWKKSAGIYVVTREKRNMNLPIVVENEFDRSDPRNNGVISDQMVAPSDGETPIRRVIYLDPVNGTHYSFLTNEFTIPPGLIAFIYKERWNIEKVYDEVKNKCHETKAWATSLTAKCQQAQFIALTHNLMLIFERKLERDEGITDEKVKRKRQARLEDDIAQATASGRQMSSMLKTPKRPTQRSLQFFRWLRAELTAPTSWRHAIDILRPLMMEYLC